MITSANKVCDKDGLIFVDSGRSTGGDSMRFRSFYRSFAQSDHLDSLFTCLSFLMKLIVATVVCFSAVAHAFLPNPRAAARPAALFASTADAPVAVASRYKTKAPVFDEVCDTTGVTLTRFMTEVSILNPELKELTVSDEY